MKQYLNYDLATGNITDDNGLFITMHHNAVPVEVEASVDQLGMVDSLIKLKNSGFTAEDVIAIAKANLLGKG